MKDLTFQRFVPLQKIDEDERMVYGYASTPDLDSDGEVIKLSAIKKALPEYLKFPTIREMHQPRPAGTTKQTSVDDKGLYIGAKIVADEAWKLVKEGVYKGFSIGGNVLNRAGNIIKEIELVEISLVDVPANKKATIELWKRDGNMIYQDDDVVVGLLEKMDFEDNKIADMIRKEVIKNMAKEDIEKNEKGVEKEASEAVEKAEEVEETTEVEETEETVEKAEEEEAEEETLEQNLSKAEKAVETLDKRESEVNKQKEDVTKAVNSIAGTLAKVADTVVKLEERIAALEKLPAPAKSKAAYVLKHADSDGEEAPAEKGSSELVAKRERLAELAKLRDTMTANDFAKAGHSDEAGRLQEEIARLEK